MFMLVVDAHSKWPEELRKLFSAYELPEQVVTDNGPQFIADEFTVFLKQNGIKHLKCLPYHPSLKWCCRKTCPVIQEILKRK